MSNNKTKVESVSVTEVDNVYVYSVWVGGVSLEARFWQVMDAVRYVKREINRLESSPTYRDGLEGGFVIVDESKPRGIAELEQQD